MLSNAYLLAKIGADTAENEQHFAGRGAAPRPRAPRPHGAAGDRSCWSVVLVAQDEAHPRLDARNLQMLEREEAYFQEVLGKLAKFCKFLAGSFSAVSKRNFARKYAFASIFQALQDLHTFAPLQSQNFSK